MGSIISSSMPTESIRSCSPTPSRAISRSPVFRPLPYNPIADAGRREQQYLETWSLGRRAQSGVFVLEDYGYKKPSANLLAQSQNPGGYAHDSMEMFDYHL